MSLWTSWRRFAHRAAIVQSNMVLFVLYFAAVLPVSVVIRLTATRRRAASGWHALPTSPDELKAAHQQFS
jgi:hypothetical protein